MRLHGLSISEIQIMQDMFQRHGLRMMGLTNGEQLALLKMNLTNGYLVGTISLSPEIRKKLESSYEIKTIGELLEHGVASLHAAGFTPAEIDLMEKRLISHGFVWSKKGE